MLTLNSPASRVLRRSELVVSTTAFAIESLRSFLETHLTAAPKHTASLVIGIADLLSDTLRLIRVVTAVVLSIAIQIFRDALSVLAFHCVAGTAPAQASRIVFVTFVGTIEDAVTKPIVQNAFFEAAAALEVVLFTSTVLLVGVVEAIGFAYEGNFNYSFNIMNECSPSHTKFLLMHCF